jgi:hypothetical protein
MKIICQNKNESFSVSIPDLDEFDPYRLIEMFRLLMDDIGAEHDFTAAVSVEAKP